MKQCPFKATAVLAHYEYLMTQTLGATNKARWTLEQALAQARSAFGACDRMDCQMWCYRRETDPEGIKGRCGLLHEE